MAILIRAAMSQDSQGWKKIFTEKLITLLKNREQKKIYKDMGLGCLRVQAAPVQETVPKSEADIGPKADAGIKYPVVDKLEEKVFKKAYPDDDIYLRLSRLEKQTFKKKAPSL